MSMSAKEVAAELGTDARTLRKFLRATTAKEDQPGQGGRWVFEKKELRGLKKRYAEWAAGKRTKPEEAEPTEVDEVEEVDEDDELEIEDEDEDEAEELDLEAEDIEEL